MVEDPKGIKWEHLPNVEGEHMVGLAILEFEPCLNVDCWCPK